MRQEDLGAIERWAGRATARLMALKARERFLVERRGYVLHDIKQRRGFTPEARQSMMHTYGQFQRAVREVRTEMAAIRALLEHHGIHYTLIDLGPASK